MIKLWSKLWTTWNKKKIQGELLCVHRLADSILSISQFFPAWSIDSMQSQSKSQRYFVDFHKLIPKFIWKGKRPRRVNTILKNKVGALALPNLKICSKAIVSKTLWDWWKSRLISIGRIENPEIYTHNYSQLIFDKGSRAIQWTKDSLFDKWCWTPLEILMFKRKKKKWSRHKSYTLYKH